MLIRNLYGQRGVGMVEVLVALVILGIGVLGYTALQLRAVDASEEALSRSQAIMIMRGVMESVRANSTAQNDYAAAVRTYTSFTASTTAPTTCFNSACTPTQLATFDAYEAAKSAFNLGMKITMADCPGVSSSALIKRQCLFAAWGNTTLSVTGSGASGTADYSNCMSSTGIYVAQSQCIMMEAY